MATCKQGAESRALAVSGYAELPGKLGETMQMCDILSRSQMIPAGFAGKPEAIFAVVQYGKELGVPAMTSLQNMSYINGKPSCGTELMLALCRRNPEWYGLNLLKLTNEECKLEVIRRRADGTKEVYPGAFTIEEARTAGLTSKNTWTKWRKRMLWYRALAFALRDGFADSLIGLHSNEEMDPAGFAVHSVEEMRSVNEVDEAILEEKGPKVEVTDIPKGKEVISKSTSRAKKAPAVKGKAKFV